MLEGSPGACVLTKFPKLSSCDDEIIYESELGLNNIQHQQQNRSLNVRILMYHVHLLNILVT